MLFGQTVKLLIALSGTQLSLKRVSINRVADGSILYPDDKVDPALCWELQGRPQRVFGVTGQHRPVLRGNLDAGARFRKRAPPPCERYWLARICHRISLGICKGVLRRR